MIRLAVLSTLAIIITACAQQQVATPQAQPEPSATKEITYSSLLTIGVVRASLSNRTWNIRDVSVSCLYALEGVSLSRPTATDPRVFWSVESSGTKFSVVKLDRPGQSTDGSRWRVHWPSQVVEPLQPGC